MITRIEARCASFRHATEDQRQVDQHASQFRLRPEKSQQRLGVRWDLRWEPLRWVNADGAVSDRARFCAFATSRRLPRWGGVDDDAAVAAASGDATVVAVRFQHAGVRRSQQVENA